jgi:hypothetical protein
MKDLKNSYRVQLAEYVTQRWQGSLCCVVNLTSAKQEKQNQATYWVKTPNFGIKVPKSIAKAKAFNQENQDTLWWDPMCNEMKYFQPAFGVWEKDISELPPVYQKITCNMIFEVKTGEKLRRKAHFVADCHKTMTPAVTTYSLVVLRDSVCIALTIAALNNLSIMACDIQKPPFFVMADCREMLGCSRT